MQFLPATWERYGAGGDIQNFRDSVLAASRLFEGEWCPDRHAGRLYRYNPSDSYVAAVEREAQRMLGDQRQYLALYEWQVLYKRVSGIALLPEGWPRVPERIVAPLEY